MLPLQKENSKKHKRRHCKAEVQDVHKCMKCDKNFTSSRNLVTHVKEVHDKIRPYSCDICEKDFAVSPSNSTEHSFTFTGYFNYTICKKQRVFHRKCLIRISY